MNILVLHSVGELAAARPSQVDYIQSFERFAPGHQYLYQDLDAPVTPALKRIRFDLILLDSTFLDARGVTPREIFHGIRRRYDFVRNSEAVKIALPQDEYDHGLVLDDWLAAWGVDVVFACGVHAHWDVVFPRTARVARLEKGLTGFYDPARAEAIRRRYPPLAERPLDLGYRAMRLPPEFGRFGAAKWKVADVFARAVAGRPIAADLSTEAERMFMGQAWWDFLGRCKFTLGCESGSSVWDPYGEIRGRVRAYFERHPGASFDEVEAACFPGVDGRYVFRNISPRLFEATATGTSQILIRGEYLGILKPWEHYLPVEPDFSNVEEVLDALDDREAAARRVDACHETFAGTPALHYQTFVRRVLGVAEEAVAARGLRGSDPTTFRALREIHERVAWSGRLLFRGVSLARRLGPLRNLIPVGLQARLLARFGRRVGLKGRGRGVRPG